MQMFTRCLHCGFYLDAISSNYVTIKGLNNLITINIEAHSFRILFCPKNTTSKTCPEICNSMIK